MFAAVKRGWVGLRLAGYATLGGCNDYPAVSLTLALPLALARSRSLSRHAERQYNEVCALFIWPRKTSRSDGVEPATIQHNCVPNACIGTRLVLSRNRLTLLAEARQFSCKCLSPAAAFGASDGLRENRGKQQTSACEALGNFSGRACRWTRSRCAHPVNLNSKFKWFREAFSIHKCLPSHPSHLKSKYTLNVDAGWNRPLCGSRWPGTRSCGLRREYKSLPKCALCFGPIGTNFEMSTSTLHH